MPSVSEDNQNQQINEFGQKIGPPINDWEGALAPDPITMNGRFCHLKPFDLERDSRSLYESFDIQNNKSDWTYLYNGPFDNFEAFYNWLEMFCCKKDPLFFSIFNQSGEAVGFASYLRIKPEIRSIEVGTIHFSPRMQKTALATESMYLMMLYVFEQLNYRRYEWKTDSMNQRSRDAALRLGFKFEGIFKQAAHYKGRNRDTAWYAIVDSDWPNIKHSFESWLNPSNFDESGKQKQSLNSFRKYA